MMVPPVRPPALRKIWAAGRPVGDARMLSKSLRQKQKVIVSIQPTIPETTMASRIARGPRIAASWVSSDILYERSVRLIVGIQWGFLLSGPVIVSLERISSSSKICRGLANQPWSMPQRESC